MPGDMTHFQIKAFQTIEVVLRGGGGRNIHRIEIINFKILCYHADPVPGSGWICFLWMPVTFGMFPRAQGMGAGELWSIVMWFWSSCW